MSKYYCLIAGLPDIHIDDQKLTYSVASFKDDIYEQLSAKDRKLFDLFFLKYDNANLLHLLAGNDDALDERGLMSGDELSNIVKQLKEDEPVKNLKAPYFQPFIASYFQEKNNAQQPLPEDELSALYYAYAIANSNSFVREWYAFNLNLNNLLIASAARKFNFDASRFIVGDNEVAKQLRTSSARDWGLNGVIDYVDEVMRLSDESDLTERERKIDQLKWNWLEEHAFFHFFTVERLFAYMLQLELIERWYRLNKEEGEARLREMIARLKSEVRKPEEDELNALS